MMSTGCTPETEEDEECCSSSCQSLENALIVEQQHPRRQRRDVLARALSSPGSTAEVAHIAKVAGHDREGNVGHETGQPQPEQ